MLFFYNRKNPVLKTTGFFTKISDFLVKFYVTENPHTPKAPGPLCVETTPPV